MSKGGLRRRTCRRVRLAGEWHVAVECGRRSGWAVERGAAELFRSRCAAAPGQAPRGQQPHMADEAVADEAPAPTEAPAEPPAEPAAEPAEAPTEAPAAPAEATPTETGALCTCG